MVEFGKSGRVGTVLTDNGPLTTDKSQKVLRKNVSASEDARRIEGAFECGHLAQVIFAVQQTQVVALQFSNAVLCRYCPAHFNRTLHKPQVDLSRLRRFVVVSRQDVDVNVVVADVAEDGVSQLARSKRALIK